MREMSEQYFSAGWAVNLEYHLWAALRGEPTVNREWDSEQLKRLDELSKEGWWVLSVEGEFDPISIPKWKRRYKQWRLKVWQQLLFAQQQVWTVLDRDSDIGNLYDSAESAEVEVRWRKARGEYARVVCLGCLHNLELSRERWEKEL